MLKAWYERKWRVYKNIHQPPVEDPWEVLMGQTQSSYEAVYQWFGEELLDSGYVFSYELQQAHARGYSTGCGAFLRGILPWY